MAICPFSSRPNCHSLLQRLLDPESTLGFRGTTRTTEMIAIVDSSMHSARCCMVSRIPAEFMVESFATGESG